jgi:uncharacterized RDD family membrane protein YckC
MFGVVWPLPRAVQFPTLARRVVALLLDLIIALPSVPLALALTYAVSGPSLHRYDTAVRVIVLTILLYAIYFAHWESSSTRATPGKMLLDLRVATTSDAPLTFADAMVRFALRFVTLLSLNTGLWFAWRSARGQALHDRFSGTVVVAHDVTPGQLRRAARPPQERDIAVAIATSLVAYALVFQLAPAAMRQFDLADRFDTVIAEVTPALQSPEAAGVHANWSGDLRGASDTVDALHLAMDVDRDRGVVVVRAPATAPDEDGGRELSGSPTVRLDRSGEIGDETWSCTETDVPMLARPSFCVAAQDRQREFVPFYSDAVIP